MSKKDVVTGNYDLYYIATCKRCGEHLYRYSTPAKLQEVMNEHDKIMHEE